MTTHYVNSKGQEVEIASMLHSHLINAHAKLLRDEPDREGEIEAMAAQIAANEERFAAQRKELEADGVFVTDGEAEGKTGFVACAADGDVIGFAKTEDGAWAKAWEHLRGGEA